MRVWISYDLGINGDYEGIYRWLDNNDALECGEGLAAIIDYKFAGDFLESIKEDIKANVEITKKSRVYVLYHEGKKGFPIGKFIIGKRQKPRWTGYGDANDNLGESISV